MRMPYLAVLLAAVTVVALVAVGHLAGVPMPAHAPSFDSLSSLIGPDVAGVLANVAAGAATLNSKALREKRTELVAQMRQMITLAEGEDRDFTAEEVQAYDALKTDFDQLEGRIARLEGVEASEATAERIIPALARGQAVTMPRRGAEARTEFENLGEFLHAVRFNESDQRLHYVENAGAMGGDGEMSAEMRMDSNTSGGFMVPVQLRDTIMRIEPQDALVRPRATVIPAGTPPDGAITMPALDQTGAGASNMYGGVEVKWIGEGDEKPETDVKLREITLVPHEVAGIVTVTDKLLRNWQAANTFVTGLLRGAVIQAEDYAFLMGSGVHKPLGVLNSPATKFINRATANHVTYLDLVGMVARFLMRGGQPVWSMPQSALVDIATLKDEAGRYIWQANAQDGFAGTLLGYPLRWNNRAPALGGKGDILLADFSQYLIKDGSGPFVAASEHVKFTSNKTVIKIFYNVDGAPWLAGPVREENGYEVSPFVGLDIPA